MPPNTEFSKEQAIPFDAGYDASNLKGKSVVVTGGASGIGEAATRAFVNAGAFVTFGDISEDRGRDLVSQIGEDKAIFVPCNVLFWAEQLKLFKTALERSPPKVIDIVIANAGINHLDDVFVQKEGENGEPVEPSLDILQTNLIGVMYTVKLGLFYLPKQPEGEGRDRCIMMTASLSGYLDQPGSPQYNASKWGVRGLARGLRRTGTNQSVRVNTIAPWFISTRVMPQEVKDRVTASGIEWAEVEDAAAAFLHLAADKTANGRALTIVPRTFHQRGYYDLEEDDFVPGSAMDKWQSLGSGGRHRIEEK